MCGVKQNVILLYTVQICMITDVRQE